MLRSIRLQNFKCFADQTVALGPLTLLTGQNGTGKSSVIQSLLLLKQSFELIPRGLLINGDLVSLGTAADVLYEGATSDVVTLTLDEDGGPPEDRVRSWAFDATERDTDILRFETPPEDSPRLHQMKYLAAERIGPREVHLTSDSHAAQGDVRSDGTYAVAFLHEQAQRIVLPALCKPGADSNRLIDQVAAWLGEVSPGVRLDTERSRAINRAALQVSFRSGRVTSRKLRPTAVGFGVSYTLPVLLTLLGASDGDLVLLENPEAHLHPRGQMAMGELMAAAASAGIQVLVETHSDHVLNGVRLAVKRGTVRPDDVRLHYFSRADDGARIVHRVTSPTIDTDGRIDTWPEGFFDQWDRALEELL